MVGSNGIHGFRSSSTSATTSTAALSTTSSTKSSIFDFHLCFCGQFHVDYSIAAALITTRLLPGQLSDGYRIFGSISHHFKHPRSSGPVRFYVHLLVVYDIHGSFGFHVQHFEVSPYVFHAFFHGFFVF